MPNTPFVDIASRWLDELAGNVDAKTIEHYRWSLESFVYPEFGRRNRRISRRKSKHPSKYV